MTTERDISTRTTILLVATIVVGLLHHTDHVLRVDHSGWPFTPHVNPFTFSLIAYPLVIFALLGRGASIWLRFGAVAVLTAFTLFAHSAIETPYMQYAMWAFNQSADPSVGPVENLCSTKSPGLGVAAVALAMTLNGLLILSTLSLLLDARRPRAD
jgi:hypothetical protein